MSKWEITLGVDTSKIHQLRQELQAKTDAELAFLLNFTESVNSFDPLDYLNDFVQVEITRRLP